MEYTWLTTTVSRRKVNIQSKYFVSATVRVRKYTYYASSYIRDAERITRFDVTRAYIHIYCSEANPRLNVTQCIVFRTKPLPMMQPFPTPFWLPRHILPINRPFEGTTEFRETGVSTRTQHHGLRPSLSFLLKCRALSPTYRAAL